MAYGANEYKEESTTALQTRNKSKGLTHYYLPDEKPLQWGDGLFFSVCTAKNRNLALALLGPCSKSTKDLLFFDCYLRSSPLRILSDLYLISSQDIQQDPFQHSKQASLLA
jgi:hypothetical protein